MVRDRDPSASKHEDTPKIHAFDVQARKLGSSLADQCPEGKPSCLLGDVSEGIFLLGVRKTRSACTNEATYNISMTKSLPFQKGETMHEDVRREEL